MRIVIVTLAAAFLMPAPALVWGQDDKIDIARTGPAIAPSLRPGSIRSMEYVGQGSISSVAVTLGADSSTFNRPMTCSSLSTTGGAVPFEAVAVRNTGKNTATLNLRLGIAGDPHAACVGSVDTMMAVYDGLFAAASPLTNCMMTNDDTNGAADRCSTLRNVEVPAGETRVIVLTVFGSRYAVSLKDLSNLELSFAGSYPVTLQSFTID